MRRTLLPLAVCLAIAPAAWAQSAANVLVVANAELPASVQIAEYYVRKRAIPPDQLLQIRTPVADEIARPLFDRDIQSPIATWLTVHHAHDRILYIVLTKGVPLRIAGTGDRNGTMASVDSELTLLYRRLSGHPVAFPGTTRNPYFLSADNVSDAPRFTHATQDIFLVTRLDGYTTADVMALIDRGTAPVKDGRVLLDERAGSSTPANAWLSEAADRLKAQGFADRVSLETTGAVLQHEQNVLGYYSWGSNDPAITERQLDLHFVPGAIAATFVSTDARTFAEPPPTWKIGRWGAKETYFSGSPQSLTGDLIRAGVTGASGHVSEPFLDAAARPQILFPAYLAGFNLAEAFYLALPYLSWQTVVIGDPLCSPFSRPPAADSDVNPPIDPATELPSQFSARRLAAPVLAAAKPGAAQHVVLADSRIARGDLAGARTALEAAVAADENLPDAWTALAALYERMNEPDKAIPIYEKLVARNPNDAAALNNLAYGLAVRQNKPQDALPLAERALKLQPRSAMIADTVAWIKHLVGDDATAARIFEQLVTVAPKNAEVQFHAASVFAAIGRMNEAATALAAAQTADPAIKNRADFKAVQSKLTTKSGR